MLSRLQNLIFSPNSFNSKAWTIYSRKNSNSKLYKSYFRNFNSFSLIIIIMLYILLFNNQGCALDFTKHDIESDQSYKYGHSVLCELCMI